MNLKQQIRELLKTRTDTFTHRAFGYLGVEMGLSKKAVANAVQDIRRDGAIEKVGYQVTSHGQKIAIYQVCDVSKLEKDDDFQPMTPQQRKGLMTRKEQEVMGCMNDLQGVLDKITREQRI